MIRGAVSRLLGRTAPVQKGLVLHLGDFKTGSTAIQSYLAAHGMEHGIHYPPLRHVPLAENLSIPSLPFGTLAEALKGITGHVLISAEHFEYADPEKLKATLERYLPAWAEGARFIAYVRPHAPALLARYAESTKIGSFSQDIEAYLDRPQTRQQLYYAPRFKRWQAVFKDRFTLRLYDRAGFPGGDVRRDLIRFITEADPGPLPATAPNPTPGLRDLALLRALHRAIGPLPKVAEGARWTLGRHIGRLVADQAARSEEAENPPLRWHLSAIEKLTERYAQDAAETDAAFFNATPLSDALAQAPEQAIKAAQSLDSSDRLSPEVITILALWGKMLRDGLIRPDGPELVDRLWHE